MPSSKARDQRAHIRVIVCSYCNQWGPLEGPGGNFRVMKLGERKIYIHERCAKEWHANLAKQGR